MLQFLFLNEESYLSKSCAPAYKDISVKMSEHLSSKLRTDDLFGDRQAYGSELPSHHPYCRQTQCSVDANDAVV